MEVALQEAQKALEQDEVPIGAIVVAGNKIIAKGYNMTEKLTDATAHAEMIALTAASEHLGGKYLNDCTLFVTLEPCPMCAAAMYWTQLGQLVFGADDPRRGFSTVSKGLLHPKTNVITDIKSSESEVLLQDFFRGKR